MGYGGNGDYDRIWSDVGYGVSGGGGGGGGTNNVSTGAPGGNSGPFGGGGGGGGKGLNASGTPGVGGQGLIIITYTPVPPPTVTGVSPSTGAPGTTVVITGSNFLNASSVTFGGVSASFTVNSSGQITATVPPGSGTVNIIVTTPPGTSAVSSADRFTYLAEYYGSLNMPMLGM